MIQLENKSFIGEGDIRFCYEHPNDKSLCVKVPKKEKERYMLKEIVYLKKQNKKNKGKYGYKFYSEYHNTIQTNLGTGQVYDLIRDETTGEVSKTVEFYLKNTNLIKIEKMKPALSRLKKEMIANRIFARDLRARNVCVKQKNNGDIDFVIVDGIGHRDFFPVAEWFKYFAVKKVGRNLSRHSLYKLDASTI